ncbi:hypothetical protein GS501_03970 [Saccharibacter sp. 17.LH.SD]|uniref:hypothetical protein n=1 Tax=Saccharibacter sp. 17.LH.SD TaxID=2689393 RepID=UPI00136959A1|nr:hypothetical protein [Saccharibacter sp. 17.LH.SD]MXV44209.1 hypothetical protein [Saccharibacter sp. 17.LH.SD]
MLGVVTGLQQEARLITRVMPGVPLVLSHADEERAYAGVQRLREEGVTELLSFGYAGGLAPSLHPGMVIVANRVCQDGHFFPTDEALSKKFGALGAIRGDILHSPSIVGKAWEKRHLYQETGCIAVDMESGVVAQSGLPFAVLRVVCDDAGRDLPPAASECLKDGRVQAGALLRSLLKHPGQISSLVGMGRDSALARQAMETFLDDTLM